MILIPLVRSLSICPTDISAGKPPLEKTMIFPRYRTNEGQKIRIQLNRVGGESKVTIGDKKLRIDSRIICFKFCFPLCNKCEGLEAGVHNNSDIFY